MIKPNLNITAPSEVSKIREVLCEVGESIVKRLVDDGIKNVEILNLPILDYESLQAENDMINLENFPKLKILNLKNSERSSLKVVESIKSNLPGVRVQVPDEYMKKSRSPFKIQIDDYN